jgi:hypothetical protein
MANILAAESAEMRAKGEAMIQQADRLLCESWNERMWSDGEPVDPSPTIDQAVNGGYPWLEIRCARCKTQSDVDLAARYRKSFLDFVPRSYCESRLWLEVIDCASKQFVHKTAHIVGRENDSTFFVDQIAPAQGVVPNVGDRISQES